MDENLQRLARELRKEKCPARVLEEVARRIRAEEPAPKRIRFGIIAAAAGLALLCGLAVWPWQTRRAAPRGPELARSAKKDSAQIAAQAEGALGYVGRILLEASAQSQQVILEEAVPPLRNSFETAKNKITNLM